MSYILVWEFQVAPERRAAFERAYGSNGDWARLFAKAPGFLGAEMLADAEEGGRYLTIDRWDTRAHFDDFKRAFGAEYHALDVALEGLAERETPIGAFTG
jgi:heme-degrading monooxygenase HmoA